MIIDFDFSTILIGSFIYIVICFYLYKRKGKEKIYFLFSTIMFFYFMCVIKLTLFPIVMLGLPANIKESIHLIPFQEGIQKTDLLNLLMTVPLGIGTPFIAPIYNIKRSALLGIFTGIVIELIQYMETFLTGGFSYRIIDINDVIFNFIGCLLGFFALSVFSNFFKKLSNEQIELSENDIKLLKEKSDELVVYTVVVTAESNIKGNIKPPFRRFLNVICQKQDNGSWLVHKLES